jgi:hypothetical protein
MVTRDNTDFAPTEGNESNALVAAETATSITALTINPGGTILPDKLAILVTRLSYIGTLSIRSSALLAEAALEGARFGTITSLELGRRTLEGLVSSVFDVLVRDSNNFGAAQRGAFGSLVEKYSNLGVCICEITLMRDLLGVSHFFASRAFQYQWLRLGAVVSINGTFACRGECASDRFAVRVE